MRHYNEAAVTCDNGCDRCRTPPTSLLDQTLADDYARVMLAALDNAVASRVQLTLRSIVDVTTRVLSTKSTATVEDSSNRQRWRGGGAAGRGRRRPSNLCVNFA